MAVRFHGILPPMVTPFDSDEEIDELALRDEARFMLSTGEVHVLSIEETCRVTRIVKDDARSIHERLLPVWRAIHAPNRSARIKAALEPQGRKVGHARHPLLPVTDDERS